MLKTEHLTQDEKDLLLDFALSEHRLPVLKELEMCLDTMAIAIVSANREDTYDAKVRYEGAKRMLNLFNSAIETYRVATLSQSEKNSSSNSKTSTSDVITKGNENARIYSYRRTNTARPRGR